MLLSRILKNKPFCNDLHLLLIPVILFFIALKHHYFVIVLIAYLLYILIKTKYFAHVICLLLIFIAIIGIKERKAISNMEESYTGIIVEIKNEKSYIIRASRLKILVYDKTQYSVGDKVCVLGKVNEIPPKGYEGDFDYTEYLKSKGISFSFIADDSNCVGKGFTLSIIKARYLAYLKRVLSPNSYLYVEGVVFGNNLLDKEIKDSYSALGISHILAISGMHIMLLFKAISFILFKLFNYYKKAIPLALVSVYVAIIGAPPSSLRALLFLILAEINEYNNPKYTRLDILSFSCLLMLMLNPYQIYSVGFIMSYLVSFILIFTNELVDSKGLKGMLNSYIYIYLITLPFVINMSNRISLISLILSPILSIFITYILLPLSYLIALVPYLDLICGFIYSILNIYVVNLSQIIPIIKMPYINPLFIGIYYLLFAYFIYRGAGGKNRILPLTLIVFYLSIIKIVTIYNPFITMTFLDCGQGDCTIIKDGDDVIVVDAFNSFDYLRDLGIDNIDYLILTHSDKDHLGDYIEILSYFDVDNLLYPVYDTKLRNLLKGYDAKAIEAGYLFKLGRADIEFISPHKDYLNENMNSLVMDVNIMHTRVLLCADITKEVELDLIKIYDDLKCDILKAGHHGSITSSSMPFLLAVDPDYSIISAGLNNRYGHPDSGVVKRLNMVSTSLSTIDRGSITVLFKENGYLIDTYR